MEKSTKKTIKFFSIAGYEKEQEYLREMHKSGWKLVSVTGFCVYRFEKCTPEDVIYQLDYNRERLADKDEYVKMFTDCGWEYIQDYVDFSYFRKPAAQTDGARRFSATTPRACSLSSAFSKGASCRCLRCSSRCYCRGFCITSYAPTPPLLCCLPPWSCSTLLSLPPSP